MVRSAARTKPRLPSSTSVAAIASRAMLRRWAAMTGSSMIAPHVLDEIDVVWYRRWWCDVRGAVHYTTEYLVAVGEYTTRT